MHGEISGKLAIPLGDVEFTLTARADRIEQRHDGTYVVVDYKTGQPPSGRQVASGMSPQLTLEGAMIRGGGFAERGVQPGSIAEVTYVRLRGGDPAGESKDIDFKDGTPDDHAEKALDAARRCRRPLPRPGRAVPLTGPSDVDDALRRLRPSRAREGMGGLGRRERIRNSRWAVMNAPPKIPPALRASQARAANPDASVFVSANAGSGKTWVLTQRVINLLLQGVDPAKILCITYTKAAAANMSNRVFDTLAQWTTLDDAAFDKRIEETIGRKPTARQRTLARRLFATAIETPGGLKVQTIHAFCTRLLHQFPFEADVAVHFEVLDESATAQLLERLTLEVMLEASGQPDGPLGQALAIAITSAADITFKEVIADMIRKRDTVTKWVNRAGGVPQAIEELTRAFGLKPDDTMEALDADYWSGTLIPEAEWQTLVEVLAVSDKATEKGLIERITKARNAPAADRRKAYREIFCTTELTRRKNLLTKEIAKANPQWLDRLSEEQDRVCQLIARENALRARDRTAALLTIASAVIEKYARAKDERGLLDYDDLIDKTLAPVPRHLIGLGALQARPRHRPCAGRRSAGHQPQAVGDHQDDRVGVSARRLARECLPHRVRGRRREAVDLFVSGRGAARLLRRQPALRAAVHRSGRAVLQREAAILLPLQPDHPRTQSTRCSRMRSRIAASPTIRSRPCTRPCMTSCRARSKSGTSSRPIPRTPARKRGTRRSTRRGNRARRSSSRPRSAARCGAGAMPERARVTCSILVRQRGPIFEAVIRALKHEGIAVAGADRLLLTEHIAVMDLMVLGDALLLPEDDLALATVLKSPLFGLSEEQLFTLAYDRKGSLRGALRKRAGEQPVFDAANRAFDELREAARTMTPFAFYAHVLGARHGRKKISARLGVEAIDPLDEFLNLALDYERRETPSLQGFLHWIRVAQSEVKRDMEMERDEVRVMTVHGAKGLEAKNVILIDATTVPPQGAYPPRLLTTPLEHAAPGATALIWGARKDLDVGPMTRCARRDDRRGAQRIPAAALCRPDARRRAAGGVRDQRRQQRCRRRAGTSWSVTRSGRTQRKTPTLTAKRSGACARAICQRRRRSNRRWRCRPPRRHGLALRRRTASRMRA